MWQKMCVSVGDRDIILGNILYYIMGMVTSHTKHTHTHYTTFFAPQRRTRKSLRHKSSARKKQFCGAGSTEGYLSSSGDACWIRILGLGGRLRGSECDNVLLCVHIQNIRYITHLTKSVKPPQHPSKPCWSSINMHRANKQRTSLALPRLQITVITPGWHFYAAAIQHPKTRKQQKPELIPRHQSTDGFGSKVS